MIEKLDPKMEFVEISILGNKKAECLDFEAGRRLNLKINELVDAVNELQTKVNKLAPNINFAQPEVKENVQDKFAEQRRWIGKICEFWDNDDTQQLSYGVLTKIDTESGFGVQYCCNDEYDYDSCEPVKPDDDIIYKGERDENK